MELQLNTSYRQILGMALPISLALLVPQINFITNNIFLSKLGEKELASAGITGVYYLIFAVIGNGLNNGLQALISRRAGQNLPKEIGRLFNHGAWVSLAVAACGIAITYLFAPIIMHAVIHDREIANQVVDFLLIRIWGLPLLYLYVMRNAFLVGTNQTRFLVWGTLSEALVNIFLDYGLIYGHFGLPKIGFNGAAYASIIAEGSGLLVIYFVIRSMGLHKVFGLFERGPFDFSIVKLILIQSSPLVVQYAISIISWEYFYILVEHHGARDLAISNTMRNIFGLSGIFSWAFASATNSMVSNILGQRKTDEVLPLIRKIITLSFSISLVVVIVLNIWPAWFLSFFSQGEEFITHGIPVIRIVSVALLMMSVGTVWLNAVTGTGNTIVNLRIEAITIVIYSIYTYLVLEYWNLPITWGWGSEWVYWISMFSMAFVYMRSGRWKGKRI
jgi:multidrug resistance protein, MATE family